MKLIRIGDICITVNTMNESLLIDDATLHMVGSKRTGDVVVTVTPDNLIKVKYKAEERKDRLQVTLSNNPKSAEEKIFNDQKGDSK